MDGECQKRLNEICKMLVKTFSGAKTCMEDYAKPPVRSSPDNFILHVCTNKSPEEIARSIIDLATSIKNEKYVSISKIMIRADDKKLEEKRCEVNRFLGKLCKGKSYYLIYHSTRIKRNHLKKGKLHLNKKRYKVVEWYLCKRII